MNESHSMKNLVVLISGRGSNLQALMQAGVPGARIAAVISNRPDAGGLAYAAAHGIATAVVDHRQYPNRAGFETDLAAAIDQHDPHVIVLAGFMRILTGEFVARYQGRLVNIHPSLLPAFPGLHTHAAALAMGVQVHGATVHFVTDELDHGPIILQAAVPVRSDDTEGMLAARVLVAEHQIYPQALRWLVNDQLTLVDGRVLVAGQPAPVQWFPAH